VLELRECCWRWRVGAGDGFGAEDEPKTYSFTSLKITLTLTVHDPSAHMALRVSSQLDVMAVIKIILMSFRRLSPLRARPRSTKSSCRRVPSLSIN
jgi:hypothetical protein